MNAIAKRANAVKMEHMDARAIILWDEAKKSGHLIAGWKGQLAGIADAIGLSGQDMPKKSNAIYLPTEKCLMTTMRRLRAAFIKTFITSYA